VKTAAKFEGISFPDKMKMKLVDAERWPSG
jgi:hypothetical protein